MEASVEMFENESTDRLVGVALCQFSAIMRILSQTEKTGDKKLTG